MVAWDYRIGFIGLGRMGREILPKINQKYKVERVYNRSPEKYIHVKALGIKTAEHPKDISENCNLIFLSLTDTEAVNSVVFGDMGLVSGLKKGSVIVDMSTISFSGSTEIHKKLKSYGVSYMDCPVIGSVSAARNSALTMVCGGDSTVLEQLKPIFQTFCRKVFLLGAQGNGIRMKLINNIVMGLNMISSALGISLGEFFGFSPDTVSEILLSGGASSKILELKKDKIVRKDFTPEFSMEHQLKDIRYGIELMKSIATDLRIVDDSENLYASACEEGLCFKDESAVYEYFQKTVSLKK